MAATDVCRQFLAEDSQLLSFRRANVRREVSADGGSPPLWSKENQLRKLGGGQPGKTTAIVKPMEGEAPVAVKTVPAQVGDLEKFAAHGLHWVPEERLYFTNLDTHVCCRPPNPWLASAERALASDPQPAVGFMRLDGPSALVGWSAESLSFELDSAGRPESAAHTRFPPRTRRGL